MIVTLRSGLVGGALLALAACSPTDVRPDANSLAAAIPAAVGVYADGCSPSADFGSGSMIDDDLAITAAHVVAGASDVDLVGPDGERVRAEVVMFDPALDLAVLRAAQPMGRPLTVGRGPEDDDRGAIATFRGTGDQRTLVVSQVSVVRSVNIDTTDIYLDRDVTRTGFEVTAEIEPGDSGAVVVLPGGIASGMIWARSTPSRDRAWAIDLPTELGDADHRASLVEPVAVGGCAG